MRIFKPQIFARLIGAFLLLIFIINIYLISGYDWDSINWTNFYLTSLDLTITFIVGLALLFRRRFVWYLTTVFLMYRLVQVLPLLYGISFFRFTNSMNHYPIYLLKGILILSLIVYFGLNSIRDYYRVKIKSLILYLIPIFIVLFGLINIQEIKYFGNSSMTPEFELREMGDENTKPFYFGRWAYMVEDSVYREFWLNDSLLVLPTDDSLRIFSQDVIDDIIFYTEVRGTENLRIFYSKPLFINDSVIILDGDEFTEMSYTANKLDDLLPNNMIEKEDELIRKFSSRKNEAQQKIYVMRGDAKFESKHN